jgi:hypothetical protein
LLRLGSGEFSQFERTETKFSAAAEFPKKFELAGNKWKDGFHVSGTCHAPDE